MMWSNAFFDKFALFTLHMTYVVQSNCYNIVLFSTFCIHRGPVSDATRLIFNFYPLTSDWDNKMFDELWPGWNDTLIRNDVTDIHDIGKAD